MKCPYCGNEERLPENLDDEILRHNGRAHVSKEIYQVRAVRVDQGPDIDGVMDDAVWARAAFIDEFIQQEPNEGAPATERTEVRPSPSSEICCSSFAPRGLVTNM